ncbi:MAG: phosphate signaling complex protein PhoU [Gammaproteobacteria bacterium]|nr:phosphate signaling complex protein PhoU [Gammaproteobacteria bacterium]MBU1655326.1 phosphate signaling complex protein PhoU [Gammaproteobacteria bacterium]MBU1962259.1 phosphate signaling complex protein PhoU [Gammaproteobacteria bacterium]
MDQSDFSHHYIQRFNAELEKVRTDTLAMGGLVEQQLADAVQALVNQDSELANHVISNDVKVNGMDVKVDELCTSILARRQPTASDLRLLLTVLRTTTDLERIGDEAKRVARMAVSTSSSIDVKSAFLEIEHLGEQVRAMLHGALNALARVDVQAALEVAQQDKRVDREYESILRQCMTYMMEDPRSIPFVLDIIWAARSLERIGDRCCNICEYLIYFVKGRDVRHTDLEEIESELKKPKY